MGTAILLRARRVSAMAERFTAIVAESLTRKPRSGRDLDLPQIVARLAERPDLLRADLARRAVEYAAQAGERASYAEARKSTAALARLMRIRGDGRDVSEAIPFEPYDYQVELMGTWDSGESVIVLKARQLGISHAVAAYMLRRAAFDGWRVGYWSRGEEEAREQLDQRVLAMAGTLSDGLRPTWNRHLPVLDFPGGGGSVRIFPATQLSGAGYTFDLAVFDELALHAFGAENFSAVAPALSAGGQLILQSTARPGMGPSGIFYEKWVQALAEAEMASPPRTALTPVFLAWDVRPGRDAEWLGAEKARLGVGSEDFAAWYPSEWEEAFLGREGLVYPMFDRGRHVVKADPVPWEACTYRVVGYDIGGGDPTAFVPLGAWPDVEAKAWRIHQYAEWYERRTPGAEEVAGILRQWDGDQGGGIDQIEADPKEASLIATLGSMCRYGHGLDCPRIVDHRWPIRKGNWARGEGLNVFREYMDSGRFTINAACKASIHEFSGYRWAKSRDPHSKELYETTTAVDHHADAMDARRLGVLGLHYLIANATQGSSTAYGGVRW